MRPDKNSCKTCARNFGKLSQDLPCEAIYRAGKQTGRPQIRVADPAKLGKHCPLTRPFMEVYHASSGAYDMDAWSQSVLKRTLQGLPRNWNIQSELNQQQLAREASYIYDAPTEWHGYVRPTENKLYPVLCYNPKHAAQVKFVEHNLVGNIIPDDSKLWVGFCGRYEGTAGVGNKAPGPANGPAASQFQTGDMIGVVVRVGTLLAKTERVLFLAKTTAAKTTGAHIVGGAYLVLITGMQNPVKLHGQKFGGTDVNIVFGISASVLKHGAKAPKYAKIAQKLLSGADKIEEWEKKELINLAQRFGGVATQGAAGLDIMNINVVDIGATTGIGISYNEWNGRIDFVDVKS